MAKINHIFLLPLLLFVSLSYAQDQPLKSAEQIEGSFRSETDVIGDNRRLFGFWSSLLFMLDHPCPPGPLGRACRDNVSTNNYDATGQQGDTTQGYNGDTTSYVQSQNYNDGSGSSQQGGNTNTNPNSSTQQATSRLNLWMLLVAAVAASFAVGAVIAGTRKKPREMHPLSGSVVRRMGLFSQFADAALCNSVNRPERVVEMTMSHDGNGAMV